MTSTGVSTLGSTVLAPNLVDTTHFPQVVQQNEAPEHSSSIVGEAHAQFHHLVHLCLCGFRHRNSWASQCHICLTEHIFSTLELASHSYLNSPNNVYTAIRGSMFDLTQVSTTHMRVVTVTPSKTISRRQSITSALILGCSLHRRRASETAPGI